MIIYSEHGKAIGSTRRSPCGCMTELVIQGEPWRTMIANVLVDYALVAPFEADCYRIDSTMDPQRYLVKAKSALENDLWVDIAEVVVNDAGEPVLSLLRIRPAYNGRMAKRHAKREIN